MPDVGRGERADDVGAVAGAERGDDLVVVDAADDLHLHVGVLASYSATTFLNSFSSRALHPTQQRGRVRPCRCRGSRACGAPGEASYGCGEQGERRDQNRRRSAFHETLLRERVDDVLSPAPLRTPRLQ